VHVNFENYRNRGAEAPMHRLCKAAEAEWGVTFATDNVVDWERPVEAEREAKWVLIVDEIEGLNPELLPDFLHTIRNLYHSRQNHALKSVILVGVSNLAAVIQDNSSPFNITDQFDVPYFTQEEVFELLGQHEKATAAMGSPQIFAPLVKEKIAYITAGQPGLVNGFAAKLIDDYPQEPTFTLKHFYAVEDWYVRKALEKNTANIINKAKKYRRMVEELLFLEKQVTFMIDDPAIKYLYTQGIVTEGNRQEVTFGVPLYKKRLENAFAVKINGEDTQFFNNGFAHHMGFTPQGGFDWPAIITAFQDYVQRRSFRYFRHTDPETGQYLTLKEASVVYAFEAFVQTLLLEVDGRSYLETHAGLGNSDLILNVAGRESVLEAKIYRRAGQYRQGLEQLKHYATRIGAHEAVYLVFIAQHHSLPPEIIDQKGDTLTLENGSPLYIYHVAYDEEKDF